MADLDAIRERHRTAPPWANYCAEDEQLWPCDTAQLLAVVDGLRAALGKIDTPSSGYFDGWAYAEFLQFTARAALADTGTPDR